MNQPPAFLEFAAHCFSPDEIGEPIDVVIKQALARLDAQQLQSLDDYLAQLLSGEFSQEQISRIWRNSGAGIEFTEGLDLFLKMVREQIPN